MFVTEGISPAKSVGRAAVLKAIDPVHPGMPPSPPSKAEQITVQDLAAAL